jgi:hypothetical protein
MRDHRSRISRPDGPLIRASITDRATALFGRRRYEIVPCARLSAMTHGKGGDQRSPIYPFFLDFVLAFCPGDELAEHVARFGAFFVRLWADASKPIPVVKINAHTITSRPRICLPPSEKTLCPNQIAIAPMALQLSQVMPVKITKSRSAYKGHDYFLIIPCGRKAHKLSCPTHQSA